VKIAAIAAIEPLSVIERILRENLNFKNKAI